MFKDESNVRKEFFELSRKMSNKAIKNFYAHDSENAVMS